MKVLPLILAAVVTGGTAPLAAKAESDLSWAGYSNLDLTCTFGKEAGCTSHPANAYNPYWTHRQNFLPDVPDDEKAKFSFTKTVNAGQNSCGKVGWQTNHIGWVPSGNGQVLTKWKENHSGTACKRVGEVTQTVKKPVWMLIYTRNGKKVAAGLYADGAGKPMDQAGYPQFTSNNSSPWMGHAVCENPEKFYGETALGQAGRMVSGHGYATLSTGERVPVTTFSVSYVQTKYTKVPGRAFANSSQSWRPPICEVVRLDLRYAPQFQNKYASVTTQEHTPSGSTLVKQDY